MSNAHDRANRVSYFDVSKLWDAWAAFEAAEHFASKLRVAERIPFDKDRNSERRRLSLALRKMRISVSYIFPIEYCFFVEQDLNDFWHLFLIDEDGFPISASLYLTDEGEVFEALKVMVVRSVLGTGKMAVNEDGVQHYVADPSLDSVPVWKMVQAYDFILELNAELRNRRTNSEFSYGPNLQAKLREMLELTGP